MATNTLHTGQQLRRRRAATIIITFEGQNSTEKTEDLRCFAPGVCYLSWLFTCCWRRYLLLYCQADSETKGKSTGWTKSCSPACLTTQTRETSLWVKLRRWAGTRTAATLIQRSSSPQQSTFLSSARTRTRTRTSTSVKPMKRGGRLLLWTPLAAFKCPVSETEWMNPTSTVKNTGNKEQLQ